MRKGATIGLVLGTAVADQSDGLARDTGRAEGDNDRCCGGRGRERFGVGDAGLAFFKSFIDAFFSNRRGLMGIVSAIGVGLATGILIDPCVKDDCLPATSGEDSLDPVSPF